MPMSATVQMMKVQNVFGMNFSRPPMSSFMSKVWTGVGHRARRRGTGPALKKAWVKRWNSAAVHAPTPSAMTM